MEKNMGEIPGKLKIELLFDPEVPFLGILFGENHDSKRYMRPSVHSSTAYSSWAMEAT